MSGGFLADLMKYGFLQYALAAGALAAVASGVMGSHIVVRRMTYVAGALSHCVLGGMGAARYLQRVHGVAWLTPMWGATIAAVATAVLLGLVSVRSRERMDTVLSAVWALGMAIGVSFIMATPGYNEDLMSYLFGNILMVSPGDLVLMILLNLVVLAMAFAFHDRFLVISFSEELARLRGIRVAAYEVLFLVMTALTVVLLVKVVGVVLVIALLTLPAATAGLFVRRMSVMMGVAVALCLAWTVGGLALSYGPDWPAGATIVELSGAAYLVCAGVLRLRRRG